MIFAMLAAVMHAMQFALQGIPGVQLIGLFISALTLTYRARALIPIYVWIMLHGIFYGFIWIIPYLYIWLPLWGIFMLAGRIRLPKKALAPIYMVLCALYGLSFGVLYAPFWAVWAGLTFNGMIAWIIAGLPVDIGYAVSNFAFGALIIPLAALLKKLDKGYR
jgi:energy-coupling factor transport system substrate-specific component